MICKYSLCNEDAGVNKNKKERNYCNNEHRRLGRNELRQEGFKSNVYYTDMEMEEIIEHRKLLSSAIKGNVKSQSTLKEKGLLYHYSREEGEWGVPSERGVEIGK